MALGDISYLSKQGADTGIVVFLGEIGDVKCALPGLMNRHLVTIQSLLVFRQSGRNAFLFEQGLENKDRIVNWEITRLVFKLDRRDVIAVDTTEFDFSNRPTLRVGIVSMQETWEDDKPHVFE